MTLPPEDATTAAWWDGTRRQQLLLQRCDSCSAVQHPPRPVCLACGGTALGWTPASGTGTVDSFTLVHRAAGPGFDPPYTVARVRLTEGPLLLTQLDGPLDGLRCDDPVSVRWRPLPDGRALPVFVLPEE